MKGPMWRNVKPLFCLLESYKVILKLYVNAKNKENTTFFTFNFKTNPNS